MRSSALIVFVSKIYINLPTESIYFFVFWANFTINVFLLPGSRTVLPRYADILLKGLSRLPYIEEGFVFLHSLLYFRAS